MFSLLAFLSFFSYELKAACCSSCAAKEQAISFDLSNYNEGNLDELYSDLQASSKENMSRAMALYEKAKEIDKHFPVVVDLNDGSYIIKNMKPDFLGERLRKKHAELTVKFGICETEDDVIIENDCLHVFPKTCKKKPLRHVMIKTGAKIIVTHWLLD